LLPELVIVKFQGAVVNELPSGPLLEVNAVKLPPLNNNETE
jgi:hypothetical protein